MKKLLLCISVISCTSHGMEIEKTSLYPATIGHMSAEEAFQEPIPADVKKDVEALLTKYQSVGITIEKEYELSSNIVTEYTLKACDQKEKDTLERYNLNIPALVTPSDRHIIWLPSLGNQVRSNLSSLGYDPYISPERNDPEVIKRALNYQPTFQNLTRVVAQRLLERLNSKLVKPMKSWVFPIYTAKKPFDDRFGIPVYEAPSAEYKLPEQLTEEQADKFFKTLNFVELQKAIKYISFAFPDKHNLFINPKDGTIKIIAQSPNNEGYGPNSRYGKAMMEETEKSLSKALHNIDNPWDGQRSTFEGVLKEFYPQRVQEWNDLYTSKKP